MSRMGWSKSVWVARAWAHLIFFCRLLMGGRGGSSLDFGGIQFRAPLMEEVLAGRQFIFMQLFGWRRRWKQLLGLRRFFSAPRA